MISLHRRGLVGAPVGTAAALATLALPRAQTRSMLRIGWTSSDGAQDPYATGARAFREALGRRVGERVEVQFFPNRALGDERPMLDGMRLGTVDMGVITNAVRLLSASGVVGRGHATVAATRAPSKALPRRRALCTNWKKPR